MIPVFDGHNDFLLRLCDNPGQRQAIWQGKGGGWHLDLSRIKAGGFVGGFFAVFVPSPPDQGVADLDKVMQNPPYAAPLRAAVTHEEAVAAAMAMVGHVPWLERTGDLSICRTAGEICAAA